MSPLPDFKPIKTSVKSFGMGLGTNFPTIFSRNRRNYSEQWYFQIQQFTELKSCPDTPPFIYAAAAFITF